MIDIKTIKKGKSGAAQSTGAGGTTYNITTTAAEAQHAAQADKSQFADRAGYADKAGEAARAYYADNAGALSPDSDVYTRFLSRLNDDSAQGRITFNAGTTTRQAAEFGQYLSGWLGTGANVTDSGDAEFNSVNVRGAIRAAELVFNRISAEEGETIRSIGHGTILSVHRPTRTATLKLDGDEYPTIQPGDICRGMYNTIGQTPNTDDDATDANGFRVQKGFFASYFLIQSVTFADGVCTFKYSLQPGTTDHPVALMNFAVYGNIDDSKPERQSCMYITAVGMAPRLLFLARMNDWAIHPSNIKVALGNIEGVNVYEQDAAGVVTIKELHGDAGLFVEDNIYLGGIVNQFTAADWETVRDTLGGGKTAQLLRGSDNIIVDALGNVVGGLTETTNGITRYKLHTGVLVFDSYENKYLTVASGTPGPGEFALYTTAEGCDIEQDGADIYITAIHNTNDGDAATVLTDAQFAEMRARVECRVSVIIETADGWRTQLAYPVKITHLDAVYINFSLDNEFDAMTYRTQTSSYDGLPVQAQVIATHNGQPIEIVSASARCLALGCNLNATGQITAQAQLQDGGTPIGLLASITYAGLFTISSIDNADELDLADGKHAFIINAVAKYAGTLYESGDMVLTVQEQTDATIYKLLLSATSISKNGSVYDPDSIDVQIQVTNNQGVDVVGPEYLPANVLLRYVNGSVDLSGGVSGLTLLTSMPALSNVAGCFTVLLIDDEDNLLDLQSVTISATGRDGAGQPWVWTNIDQIVIDCDDTGRPDNLYVLSNLSAKLYCGDDLCTLTDAEAMYNGTDKSGSIIPGRTTSIAINLNISSVSVLETSRIEITLEGEDSNGETHSATKTIPVIANRRGPKGETGDAGAGVRFRGQWDSLAAYTWNAMFRDCVRYNGTYWLVNVAADDSITLGTPASGNGNWAEISSYQALATGLIMAENGVIELLASNVITMHDAAGVKTASINEDNAGSYRIYYPSGAVRMEFSNAGYINYYNDDAANSLQWRLGHGGNILTAGTDDWREVYLYALGDDQNSWPAPTASLSFSRQKYYQFDAAADGNWTSYDGLYFAAVQTNPSVQVGRLSGYYTPDRGTWLEIDSTAYKYCVYHIVNGAIAEELIISD